MSSGGITGAPTTEGLFSFTIRLKDFTGTTDTESFSIRIAQPHPLVITNQSDKLSREQSTSSTAAATCSPTEASPATPGHCAPGKCRLVWR